jgi:hypothetical protein
VALALADALGFDIVLQPRRRVETNPDTAGTSARATSAAFALPECEENKPARMVFT